MVLVPLSVPPCWIRSGLATVNGACTLSTPPLPTARFGMLTGAATTVASTGIYGGPINPTSPSTVEGGAASRLSPTRELRPLPQAPPEDPAVLPDQIARSDA